MKMKKMWQKFLLELQISKAFKSSRFQKMAKKLGEVGENYIVAKILLEKIYKYRE